MVRRGGKLPNEVWETFRAMSVDVGRQIPFLAETSCMNMEERVSLACLRFVESLFEIDDPEFVQFLNDVAIPYVKYVGRAKWERDIVTDLGLALSMRKEREARVDRVLNFDPSQLSSDSKGNE